MLPTFSRIKIEKIYVFSCTLNLKNIYFLMVIILELFKLKKKIYELYYTDYYSKISVYVKSAIILFAEEF